MFARTGSFVVSIALASQCHATCTAQAGATRPHLVELYTSEGCSSCPPADAWLRTLPAGVGVVALAFHVDYWDALGWRDRFADARHGDRQRQQARRDGSESVYTPQVVLDGKTWQGWYRGAGFGAEPSGKFAMRLTATSDGASVQAHIDAPIADGVDVRAYRYFVALTVDGLSTKVSAGENSGATLRHDHVVRNFAGPLPASSADVRFDMPADADWSRSALVAFAQDPERGDVAQVLRLPLGACR
jgi:hypothetical protein